MKFFPLLFDIVSCCISWAGKENVSTGQTAIGRLMDLNHSHMWLCLVLIMLTNVTTHSKNQNFFFSLLRPVCDMVRMQSSKYDLEPLVSNCPLNWYVPASGTERGTVLWAELSPPTVQVMSLPGQRETVAPECVFVIGKWSPMGNCINFFPKITKRWMGGGKHSLPLTTNVEGYISLLVTTSAGEGGC